MMQLNQLASLILSYGILILMLANHGLATEKPDVLFIAVDDLNDWTGHLGGHPQARTPNIDRLVARGVTFTNAHCAAPACNPSRAALMSGLRPWTTGIYTNGDPAAGVLKSKVTINRHFLAHGYNAYGCGKIYHGFDSEGRDDTWTEWAGLFPSVGSKDENLNGLDRSHFDWGPIDAKTEDMGDYKATQWAIDKLMHPGDKPMFLALGYIKPHLPWYIPKEYFDRFPLESIQLPVVTATDLSDVPAAGRKMANPDGDHAAVVKGKQWHKGVQAYLATISFLDDQVGRLLTAIEASPRGKNTIVVWWTDHGWHLGEKEHWRKFALWEEATRTSFAIMVPHVTKPGARCSAPVDYTSIFPTLCELTGTSAPAENQGPSLVPLLNNVDAPWKHVAVCTHGRGNHAARDSRYRYIRYADGSEELYDHQSDPHEWQNLADRDDLISIKQRLGQAFPNPNVEVDATSASDEKQKEKKKKRTRT